MIRRALLSSLLLTRLLSADVETLCHPEKTPLYQRLALRTTQGTGVGYNKGYTTLEGFLISQPAYDTYSPFLDLRAHVFNDGKPALNAGLGVRFLSQRIWGANAYYDYRKTHRYHYNQLTVGVESLGSWWDWRLNAYFPLGDAKSKPSIAEFHNFAGNSLFLSRNREIGMSGFNAEVGFHFDTRVKPLSGYVALGPYYFAKDGRGTGGGQVRGVFQVLDYVKLEGDVAYDRIFEWTGQGQISVMIPLNRCKPQHDYFPGCNVNCCDAALMRQRMAQSVDRFEIVVVDKKKKNTVAIDPATGLPYTFWFVDNTSHSNGTFESPFNNLLAAQTASAPHDVIYVFPGDGTSTNMNVGITLQDYQRFFGSGVSQQISTTLGNITIPAMSLNAPTMANPSGGFVVQLGSHNVVSGFNLQALSAPGSSISSSGGITDATIINNTINVGTNGNGVGIFGQDFGTIVISNNNFQGIGNFADGCNLQLGSASNMNITIDKNSFARIFNGVQFSCINNSNIFLGITNNSFSNITNDGCLIQALNSAILNTAIAGNTFNTIGNVGCFIQSSNNSIVNSSIASNNFVANNSISLVSSDATSFNVVVQNNIIAGKISLSPQSTSSLTAIILDNTIVFSGDTIVSLPSGAASWNYVIENNFLQGSVSQFVPTIFIAPSLGGGTGPGTLQITNNRLDVIGGITNAIDLILAQSTIANISNNTITRTNNAASISVTNTGAAGNLCLRILNNKCDRAISLSQSTGATFNEEASGQLLNVPTPTRSGTINSIPDGSCLPVLESRHGAGR